MEPNQCSVKECTNSSICQGWCRKHYDRARRNGGDPSDYARPPKLPCGVEGCQSPTLARSLCSAHYQQVARTGAVMTAETRKKAPNGAGGYNEHGYRLVTISGRRILEHRYVMEGVLGRRLLSNEHVHHINGIRDDNRPENLEIWVRHQPTGARVDDRVADALAILAKYAPHHLVD